MPLTLLLCFCICLAYKSLEIVEKRNQIARLSSKSCLLVAVQHAEQGKTAQIWCLWSPVRLDMFWMSRPFWWAMPLLWKCPTRVVWLTSSPWRPLLLLKLVSEISREQRETASLWCGCFKASLQLPVRASPFGTAHKPRKEIIGPDVSHKLLYMFDALNEQLLYIRGVFKMSFLSI